MPVDVLNPDIAPVAPADQTPGPRLGFLEGMAANYDDQARNGSLLGLQKAFADEDDNNAAAARAAGIEYTPLHAMPLEGAIAPSDAGLPVGPGGETAENINPTLGTNPYKAIAQSIMDKVDNYSSPAMREQDARVNDLNLKTPGLALKSMSDIYASVQQQAQAAERRAAFPKTFMGGIGGFIGGSIAGMDPRTDPLNAASLVVGGAGETALARIGIQGGVQGLSETINQLTGVQENRRLLGLSHSDTDALSSIALAAVGGAAVQGMGEAGAAALRKAMTGKWFADTPHDPAPPIPEQPTVAPPIAAVEPRPPFATQSDLDDLLSTRNGYARALGDLDYTTQQLAKWGADEPWKIPPPTDTRVPGAPIDPVPAPIDLSPYTGVESKDSIARRIDPDTFTTYDKLATKVQDLRSQLSPPELAAGADEAASRDTVRDQITQIEASMQNARGSRLRKLTQQLEDLKASVDPTVNTVQADDLRSQLITADQHMRDLAPAVTRAYALADKKWTAYNEQKAQIDAMMTEARPALGQNIPVIPGAKDIGEPPLDLIKRSPAQHVPEMEGVVPDKDEPMVHTVQKVQAAQKIQAEDATAQFQAEVPKILDPPEVKDVDGKVIPTDKNILMLKDASGKDISLHLDDDVMKTIDADGNEVTMSVRQMLNEVQKDNEMMKAIGSCSLPETS